jgi:hypothetical protein
MKKYICQFKKANPNSKEQKTIMAIKILREHTGCGLKQAKNIMDGKLALMTEAQVVNFIKECGMPSSHLGAQGLVATALTAVRDFDVDAICGFEWEVGFHGVPAVAVWRPGGLPAGSRPPESTGYLFVVHREVGFRMPRTPRPDPRHELPF